MNPRPDVGARLVAHRGACADYPENTLLALQMALAAGARAVEFDIQMSADGVAYMIHDPVLMRTAGRRGTVMRMDARELDRVSVHEPSRFADRFAPQPMPRLAAVVDLLNDYPQCTAFVELKRHALRQVGVQRMSQRVVAELQRARFKWVLISFDHTVVECARGARLGACGWVLPGWDAEHRLRAESLAPDYLFVNVQRVGDDALWPGPWRWAVYELGDWPSVTAWLDRGADLVETNSILRLLHATPSAGAD